MSIHTVTKEITVTSEVEVLAPPGERTETVTKIACQEVERVCEKVGLKFLDTMDIYIGNPVYQEGRKWLVSITAVFRSTAIINLED